MKIISLFFDRQNDNNIFNFARNEDKKLKNNKLINKKPVK